MSVSDLPVVSVIVTTYNRPVMLERQLRALSAQYFDHPWEVFVVHDGPPSDETIDVCKSLAPLYEARGVSFVGGHVGDEASGYYCVPCNWAIAQTRGEFLMFLDDDNEIEPDAIKVLFDAHLAGEEWPDFTYGRRRYKLAPGYDGLTKSGHQLEEGDSPLVEWDNNSITALGVSAVNNFVDKGDMMVTRGALWRLACHTNIMWQEAYRRFGDWEIVTRGTYFAGWRGKAVDAIVQTYWWHGQNLQLTRSVHEIPQARSVDELTTNDK